MWNISGGGCYCALFCHRLPPFFSLHARTDARTHAPTYARILTPVACLELNRQLQGDPPPWVAGLVNAWTECGYIRCIEKYSKYQHIVNHAIARNPDLKGNGAPSSSLNTVDVS